MPTHAEIASQLLADAAAFFRNMGEQNETVRAQMKENATVFEQMAELLAQDPGGRIDDKSHGELAGRLLADAANFFRALAVQNEPIREQMEQNADAFAQLGELVSADPLGVLD